MIQSKIVLVVVALSAPGLAARPGQDPPDPAEAPTASAAPTAPAEKYVLLRNGRLVKGVVTEKDDEDAVVITSSLGAATYRGDRIEKVCDTIRDVHAYKCTLVPEDDPDEQMKLAQWCLTNGLRDEARGHLGLILKLDPKHRQAVAMRGSLDQADVRLANAKREPVDEDVRQAGGDVVDDRPAALDPAIVLGARRMGVSDLPVVFDLPPNAAVRRAQEFRQYVHPVLQLHCAKCHDERHDGEFQLVPIGRKADQTAAALRANLDATLRLVDREEPGKSELLSSSLRPHGNAKNPRPIFQGSNDRAYQILSAWVNSLRSKPVANPLAGPARPAAAAGGGEEGFAVDRSRITRGTATIDPIAGEATLAPPPTRRVITTPDLKYEAGRGFVEDQGGDDAPVPFAVSGKMPKGLSARPAPADDAVAPTSTAGPSSPSGRSPTLTPEVAQALAEAEARAAGGAPPLPPPGSEAEEDDAPDPAKAAKKPAKAMKLDPALLQKALEKKNAAGG
ncbi:MAG: hypothetical protein BGO49_27960 [Planctomycetales bacterium 71-10]|mgnify:CR=1 FL=1|nr:MAG: hypothetical protein BGO49_27960 [Planctomycetales bacterium 71-10]